MKKQLINLYFFSLIALPALAQVPSYVPTNGLVGYWPFNGNANDESGNGNDGTVNGATLTTDRFGVANKAYSFDGATSYIEVLDDNSLDVSSVSVSCWINPNDFGSVSQNHQGHIFSKREASGWGNSFQMAVTTTTPNNGIWANFTIGSNNWVFYNPSVNPLQVNSWIFVTYTHDSNEAKLYINGELKNSLTILGGLSSNNLPLWFGARPNAGVNSQFYDGKLDDIGIWNRALTQCEIQDLYHAQLNSATGISAGPDQTVCDGDSITLSGSGGTNYVWNNSVVDGVPFIPTASMEYPVLGQDANGCFGTDTMHLELISTSSSTLTETALDSYTLNGQTYTQSGTYTQVIPNAAGCDSTITLNLTLNFTGLNELQSSITVAPNPTMDFLTITSSNVLYEEYVLFDPQGRKVLSGTLTGTTNQLDLSKLARGNYLLQIGEKRTPIKLIKE